MAKDYIWFDLVKSARLDFIIGTNVSIPYFTELHSDGVIGLSDELIRKWFPSLVQNNQMNYALDFKPLPQNSKIQFGVSGYENWASENLIQLGHNKTVSKIDFFGIQSYFDSQDANYLLLDSSIINVLVPRDVFEFFKDNYITTGCFAADDFLSYPTSDYICYCDGGIPPGFPPLNIILDNSIFTMNADDYIHIPFINNQTRRSYCELGVQQYADNLVCVGSQFIQKYTTVFDLTAQKIYINEQLIISGVEYNFWNTFDLNLAITGSILFIIFLVFIIYFAFIMHKRHKNKKPKLRFVTRNEIADEGIN